MSRRGPSDPDKISIARITWDPKRREWIRAFGEAALLKYLEGYESDQLDDGKNPKRHVRQVSVAEFGQGSGGSALIAARRDSGGMVFAVKPEKHGHARTCQVVHEWARYVINLPTYACTYTSIQNMSFSCRLERFESET
jgi:hypothetical protein